MQQPGDSDYNKSRDRAGQVQERVKSIPGKRYGTKKKRNGRSPNSCTEARDWEFLLHATL